MFRKLTVLLVLAALGLSAGSVMAAFENVIVSPRARAMGETGIAVQDGPYATYLNPAHLAGMANGGFTASYVRPFNVDFADRFHVGASQPLSAVKGGFGLSLTQFKVKFQGFDLLDDNPDETTLLEESTVSLGYARTMYEDYHSKIALGASLNLYHLKFGESVSGIQPGNDSCFGIDVGMVMTLHKRTHVAFLVKNINNPMIGIDEEELRRGISAGISYEPYEGVITTFEFDNELGEDVQYHGGAEMMIFDGFALRAGVLTNPNKLTGGFGYYFRQFSFNYGFSTGGGVLENTHQFGVNVSWGGEAK